MEHRRKNGPIVSLISLLLLAPMAAATTADDVVCKGCVDTADIARDSIIKSRIRDGSVTTSKLKNRAVGTNKLRDGAVTYTKLSADVRALLDAITDLEAELTALKSFSVAGSSYLVNSSYTQLSRFDANPSNASTGPGAWNVDLYIEQFSLTFNQDVDQTVTLQEEREVYGNLRNDGSLYTESEEESDTETLYWTQENQVVSISDTLGGDSFIEFFVPEGASVIYSADPETVLNEDTGSNTCGNGSQTCYQDYFDSGILFGVRVSNPAP